MAMGIPVFLLGRCSKNSYEFRDCERMLSYVIFRIVYKIDS